ncbi:MAG TPA: cytochrome c biogenesis protein CcsA [Bacillota bacterium]
MRLLGYAALVAVPVALYASFLWAPTEAFMGEPQRIMYIHVPAALGAYLSFATVAVAGAVYLGRRRTRWDALAQAAAEVGVLFTTITLITGSLWARAVWGWWWTWDPRLTTTLVLWFLYVAYLVMRQAIDDPARRGRFSAIFGIIGFLDVPVVHLSVEWWRSLHPPNIASGGTVLDPAMQAALAVSTAAFLLVNVLLIWLRCRVELLERAVTRFHVVEDWSPRE